MTTPLLALPEIAEAQAQKHVTHNDALLMLALVHLSVKDRDLATPPGSPAAGDRYIVAATAPGAWAGWEGSVAFWDGTAWARLVPVAGWRAWVADEGVLALHDGSDWLDTVPVVAGAALGGRTTLPPPIEETLSGLSGATVDSTVVIPDRAVVFGVSTRTVTTITGATSYDCGTAAAESKFGATLGAAAGSTNRGVIGPEAFYADTAIRLTANGGNFTGGAVRLAIHYLTVGVPD